MFVGVLPVIVTVAFFAELGNALRVIEDDHDDVATVNGRTALPAASCSGWSPPSGQYAGQGGSCAKWPGSAAEWCYVDAGYSGEGGEFLQPSTAYAGKWYIPCTTLPCSSAPAPAVQQVLLPCPTAPIPCPMMPCAQPPPCNVGCPGSPCPSPPPPCGCPSPPPPPCGCPSPPASLCGCPSSPPPCGNPCEVNPCAAPCPCPCAPAPTLEKQLSDAMAAAYVAPAARKDPLETMLQDELDSQLQVTPPATTTHPPTTVHAKEEECEDTPCPTPGPEEAKLGRLLQKQSKDQYNRWQQDEKWKGKKRRELRIKKLKERIQKEKQTETVRERQLEEHQETGEKSDKEHVECAKRKVQDLQDKLQAIEACGCLVEKEGGEEDLDDGDEGASSSEKAAASSSSSSSSSSSGGGSTAASSLDKDAGASETEPPLQAPSARAPVATNGAVQGGSSSGQADSLP
eukprot:TRINITY_DN9650_c0_g1_i1.p1 TRINITY_DN9650_c0_g1~~TRINITY_DN9650_c0_g1_i1.p1  ORF type:complete len:457 (+),score=96.53 TRINITY_DN9650_c0_g1_i1:137-1507(+)